MKQSLKSKLLMTMMITGLVIATGCGSDDDDDGSTVVLIPENQQREEGPVRTGPSVVINRQINNTVRVINKNLIVQQNNLVINYEVVNLAPVIHQQYVYAAPSCETASKNDVNLDGIIDQVEFEAIAGSPVLTLPEVEGETIQTQQEIPVSSLPADQEDFIFVVYGAEEGVTIPVVCNSFNVNQVNVTETPEPTPEPTPTPSPAPQPEEPAPTIEE